MKQGLSSSSSLSVMIPSGDCRVGVTMGDPMETGAGRETGTVPKKSTGRPSLSRFNVSGEAAVVVMYVIPCKL